MALLEVRMVGNNGIIVPTAEDKTAPALPYALSPGSLFLSDYCFNDEGPWVKPKEYLQEKDVAAVVFSRKGQIESMVVGGRKIHDEQEMYRLFRNLHGTTMTRYPASRGKELFMFYLSPQIKRRLSRPWRRKRPSK